MIETMIIRMLTAAVVTAAAATSVAAQRGGMHEQMPDSTPSMGVAHGMMMGGMMGEGMMGSGMMQMMGQGMGMMATGGPGPMTLLRMRDTLSLTDEQVGQLEAIQQDFQTTIQAHMTAAMASHQAANEALSRESPDFDAYQQSLQAAANTMVQAHVAMARAAAEAREVLTPEQREQLRTGGAQMMRSMMEHYGWEGMMRGRGLGIPNR